MTRIRRCLTALAALGCALLLGAATAPAALATPAPPDPNPAFVPAPAIHTVVTGGMPGWQVALIAVGAALAAAVTGVLLDRARTARRPARSAA